MFLSGLVSLVGSVSLIFGKVVYGFAPSIMWVDKSRPFALGLAAFSSVAFTSLYWLNLRNKVRNEDKKQGIGEAFTLLFTPVFVWFVACSSVYLALPMMRAIVASDDVELVFVVEDADGFSERKCPNPVEFSDIPYLFNKVCGTPSQIAEQLNPGDKIAISGRGSDWGVFYKRARIVD